MLGDRETEVHLERTYLEYFHSQVLLIRYFLTQVLLIRYLVLSFHSKLLLMKKIKNFTYRYFLRRFLVLSLTVTFIKILGTLSRRNYCVLFVMVISTLIYR